YLSLSTSHLLTYFSSTPSASLPFFFYSSADHRALHSFPTRRSSDLGAVQQRIRVLAVMRVDCDADADREPDLLLEQIERVLKQRSEEHTSELQSRENLVCRLLLEKKKRRRNRQQ